MGAPDPRPPGPQGRRLSEGSSPALDVVARIEASLAAGGFRITGDSVAGRRAVIGRRRSVFVLVALFKAGMAGREHLDRFQDEAAQYAATVKSRLAPARTVAVAVVEAGGQDDSGDWAATVPDRAAAFPVLVDLSVGRVSCPGTPADLRRLVHDHVGGPSV
jgi:hypothetical protein